MRIYLHLTPNRERVPFDYQQTLVSMFHKWLGWNELHDAISLYSLSWLTHGNIVEGGFDFPAGSSFFVSSPLGSLFERIGPAMLTGQHLPWGMEVHQIQLEHTPDFGDWQRFRAQSPILIKRKDAARDRTHYYFPSDSEANAFLTETLQQKLERLGLPTDVQVQFDPKYTKARIKKMCYRHIDIKATLCPVIVEGHPRAVQAAWEVGVGNSTGIGFGALW